MIKAIIRSYTMASTGLLAVSLIGEHGIIRVRWLGEVGGGRGGGYLTPFEVLVGARESWTLYVFVGSGAPKAA